VPAVAVSVGGVGLVTSATVAVAALLASETFPAASIARTV
jgi:hypothetical protein